MDTTLIFIVYRVEKETSSAQTFPRNQVASAPPRRHRFLPSRGNTFFKAILDDSNAKTSHLHGKIHPFQPLKGNSAHFFPRLHPAHSILLGTCKLYAGSGRHNISPLLGSSNHTFDAHFTERTPPFLTLSGPRCTPRKRITNVGITPARCWGV